MELLIQKLANNAKVPFYASSGAAAMDLAACIDSPLEIAPNERTAVPTGLAMAIPEGHVGLIFPRSSLGLKMGVGLPNSVGVIDSDYRGEVKVALINLSGQMRVIEPGMRIAQIMIVQLPRVDVKLVDKLSETERGEGGFGSTGA